jgi:hypothetical protein
MTDTTKVPDITWHQCAPPRRSKRQALAALDHHITDPVLRAEYRVRKRRSRWLIEWGKKATS